MIEILIIVSLFWSFFLIMPMFNSFIALVCCKDRKLNGSKGTDFAVVVTVYKEPEFIKPIVDSIRNQKYSNYHVYVTADRCKNITDDFAEENVTILLPETNLDSKVKSIQYAIKNFVRKHDAVVILDPDNLAHPNFLKEMDLYFAAGYKAVQGRRAAKNYNSDFASLDALHEMFYNFTQRLGLFNAGSSAVIAGSGMAIDTNLLIDAFDSDEITKSKRVVTAEDKILQYEIVRNSYKIAYNEDAIVYDEKTESAKSLRKQRARWHQSYFYYLKLALRLLTQGIQEFNFNKFYFGLNVANPPLFITVLINLLLAFLGIVLELRFVFILNLSAVFSLAANLIISAIYYKAPKQVYKALFKTPVFILNQIYSLITMRRANTDFLATKHSNVITIDQLVSK